MIKIKHRMSGSILCQVNALSLRCVNLEDADLRYADLRNSDLTEANLVLANLSHANLSGAVLNSADLFQAILADADLTGASLAAATLTGANLESALLSRANLARADLTGACLRSVNLFQAILADAHLAGADLEGADLEGAVFTGAHYDGATRWPAGFNPYTSGALLPGVLAEGAAGSVGAEETTRSTVDGGRRGSSTLLTTENNAAIRLLAVEDDPLVQAYLVQRLGREPGIQVRGVVARTGEGLAFLRREAVDLVLLDYCLKGVEGMWLLQAISRVGALPGNRSPRVLFCTSRADETFEAEARAMGAAGVVHKSDISAELVPAVRAVACGSTWFDHGKQPSARGKSPSDGSQAPRWKVLVAEDEAPVRTLLGQVLPDLGCSVSLAWRAEDALRELDQEHFDLLLLDHQLAGRLLGAQMLDQIAARWPRLPVLFLTGLPGEVERYRAHPNVRGIVVKPFRVRLLQNEVLQALGRQ